MVNSAGNVVSATTESVSSALRDYDASGRSDYTHMLLGTCGTLVCVCGVYARYSLISSQRRMKQTRRTERGQLADCGLWVADLPPDHHEGLQQGLRARRVRILIVLFFSQLKRHSHYNQYSFMLWSQTDPAAAEIARRHVDLFLVVLGCVCVCVGRSLLLKSITTTGRDSC
jgi:hypothetical protein